MAGTHDSLLVWLSIVIAVGASYTALDLSNRIRAYGGRLRRLWIAAAAFALGGGIWAMHFVAMLAYSMPDMAVSYDPAMTALSFALAVVFTGIGFAAIARDGASRRRLAVAGILMGLGVVAMHYVGMAGMKMAADLSYDRAWVAISIFIAIGAAIAALWLASRESDLRKKMGAAALMGVAISGMHYAGMKAATFTAHGHADLAAGSSSVSQTVLATAVSAATFVILILALGAATLDRRLASVARREARGLLRLRLADVMRDASSERAIQEVAALMGAHFRVSRVGFALFEPAEHEFDYRVCWTDGSVPSLLGRYPASAFGPRIVAALGKGTTMVVEDLRSAEISDEAQTLQTAADVDTRAILVVPFLEAGQLASIFYLNCRQPRRWTADEVIFMEELAERTRQVIARAEVEAKLRELNATLEARVDERTDELRRTEMALRQSQKMEAIGQLTGGIAHDFNNMLMGIMGSLDILRHRIGNGRFDDLGRFMDAATTSAERAAGLTARLLAFSRRQTLDTRPTDVNLLVGSLEELLHRTMSETIAVRIEAHAAKPIALVDPNQLENAILNLAINARDAMPQGGTLSIATNISHYLPSDGEAPADPRPYVVVTVTDTGFGMDAATLERAFEPFYTTKPVGQGTGLGLSMIYGFVQQSKGQVRIDSKPGEGTMVALYLPVAERAVEELAVRADIQWGDGQHVLLVEDDPSVRLLIRAVLEELGYLADEASNPDDAIVALESGRDYDLLITDVGLPGLNGRQLAELARHRHPDLPVLFVTGYAQDATERASFLGANMDMIGKPFRIEALSAKIREMVGDERTERRA